MRTQPLVAAGTVLLVGSCASVLAWGPPFGHHGVRHGVEVDAAGPIGGRRLSENPVYTSHWIEQPIDHGNPSVGTYMQRYYIDQRHYDPTQGPIFLYLGGEGPDTNSPTGYTLDVARSMGAMLVSLEHRYYGESIPFGFPDGLRNENIQYLTIDLALRDAEAFIANFTATHLDGASKVEHPWLVVGGSYAGALSSWFRTAYPDSVVASWSSSGVVHAFQNYPEFDTIVAEAIGEECADAVRTVTAAFEAEWNSGDPARINNVLDMFHLHHDYTVGDFFYLLADSAVLTVQYGGKAFLCDAMKEVTAHAGDPAQVRQIYADYVTSDLTEWNFNSSDCFYDTACLKDSSQSDRWHPTARAWRWQKCAEVGWFQVAPNNTDSLRSTFVNETYALAQCDEIFNQTGMAPNVGAVNGAYGGLDPASQGATRIFYSQGSDDPWQGAGIRASIDANLREFTAVCDGCGHCGDLRGPATGDSDAKVQQRALLTSYLVDWINEGRSD